MTAFAQTGAKSAKGNGNSVDIWDIGVRNHFNPKRLDTGCYGLLTQSVRDEDEMISGREGKDN
jgi:hypothetical protein